MPMDAPSLLANERYLTERLLEIERQLRSIQEVVIRLDENIKLRPVAATRENIQELTERLTSLEKEIHDLTMWKTKIGAIASLIGALMGGAAAFIYETVFRR